MKEINEIFKYIGHFLNESLADKDWKSIQFNIQADVDFCGYDGSYTDSNDSIHDLDIEIPIEMDDKIWRLLELSKENNFTKWNRAVYSLESNGHFDMSFEWDQALQDKWDNK